VRGRPTGRCVAATVFVAALFIAPTGSPAARLPDALGAWLGTWHANFGTLRIDDIHRERSEFPDANGNHYSFWAASMTWSRPGADKRITGTILGGKYGYRTFAGCWDPPDPAISCGNVLIQRTGRKITGGYWKACRQNCKSHHPWKGNKTRGSWRVGFRFTQEGKPVAGPPGRTQIGGAGSLISLSEPGRGKPWRPSGDTRVFLVAEGPNGQERKLTIKPTVARYEIVGDDTPSVELRGRVTQSDDERCGVGEVVEVTITDGKKRAADKIRLDPDRESCARGARWSSLGNGEVRVSVDFARETD
jgi:hypothetical protein